MIPLTPPGCDPTLLLIRCPARPFPDSPGAALARAEIDEVLDEWGPDEHEAHVRHLAAHVGGRRVREIVWRTIYTARAEPHLIYRRREWLQMLDDHYAGPADMDMERLRAARVEAGCAGEASCTACGGPLASAADRREGLCQRHRSCHTCGREVDGNSWMLCHDHRAWAKSWLAGRAVPDDDPAGEDGGMSDPVPGAGVTWPDDADAPISRARHGEPHEVALDGLGASARLDEASRLILGLPVTASQDQRFALIDRLTGRSPTLPSAYAAQPGCPPKVRYLALLEAGSDLIDEHCRLYGDDRQAVLSALWDRLAAER